MKKTLLLCLALAAAAFGAEPKGKYAIILQAGNETNEGAARAVHALLYARELAEKGYDVALVFDGAAAGWALEFKNADNPLNKHYEKVVELGAVLEICDYCAEHFDVKSRLSDQQKALLAGDYEGHPSLVRWIEKGYAIISL